MEPRAVKSYATQFNRIAETLEEMGALVCEAISIAGEAVARRDQPLREKAKANDKRINQLQESIDRQIAEMFSKQSPMASELRYVLAAHKIATMLERTGDLAKNTTKRLVRCEVSLPEEVHRAFQRLVEVDKQMLAAALAAFRRHDDASALRVWKQDEEADQLCRTAFSSLLERICADPARVSGMVDALFAAKQLERIADYACGIAKTVLYVTTGEKPRKDLLEGI
jgi:phosphate transport system protein